MKKETQNYQVKYFQEGVYYLTLDDILPENDIPLKILFIAKTPACESVCAGHYFQGHHGKLFWNILKKYKILICPEDRFEMNYF